MTVFGADPGLRMIDLDEDGYDDLVFANDHAYGIYLFDSMKTGWSRQVIAGRNDTRLARMLPFPVLPLITTRRV